VSGGVPRESYVNPWTIVSIRHADVQGELGHLDEETTDRVAREAASYMGVR
jgi:mRNA interferase MazF